MTEQTATTNVKDVTPIIRGRIPHVIVQLARYYDLELTVKEKADKYATTLGKIDDIIKGRNFNYVTADVKFTNEQKAQGIAYAEQHWDDNHKKAIINSINAMPTATPEEAAHFNGIKKRAAPETALTSDGTKPAGGGNRRGGGKKKAEPTESVESVESVESAESAESDELSADELLGI